MNVEAGDSASAILLPRCDKGVLDNQDLLRRIFEHMPAESRPFDDQSDRVHLMWASQTCRSFLDPALDMLWRSMSSLIPLLKLLPAFQLTHDTYVSLLLASPFSSYHPSSIR